MASGCRALASQPRGRNQLVGGLPSNNFQRCQGWASPSNQTVSVTFNATNSVTGTYSVAGNLRVIIEPSGAVNAGAKWMVDGGSPHSSGAVVGNLSAGRHAVTFSAIDGWTAPANLTAAIRAGFASAVKPNYTFNAQGRYQGLFYLDSGVAEESAGAIRGLTVTSQGAYSARLALAGKTYSLGGVFDAAGQGKQLHPARRRRGWAAGRAIDCRFDSFAASRGRNRKQQIRNRQPDCGQNARRQRLSRFTQ